MLVGSEVSGAGLGRAGYDLIPHNYNRVNKRGYTSLCTRAPVFEIRITNRSLYYEFCTDNGLNVIALE